jgi:hypothetical protein
MQLSSWCWNMSVVFKQEFDRLPLTSKVALPDQPYSYLRKVTPPSHLLWSMYAL